MYITPIVRVASQHGFFNGEKVVVPVKQSQDNKPELSFDEMFQAELRKEPEEWKRSVSHA